MRAIVTGGAGFIGSNLVDALVERGDDVYVLDDLSSGKRENVSDRATLQVGDIRRDADAAFERGTDHPRDELGARRGEERCLGPRDHVAASEQHLSQPLAERRPSRLARRDHVSPLSLQRRREELGLRRLPGAVEALERHEHEAA